VAAVCALVGPATAADPAPSRPYPPTYSSRKAPWYDPLRLFTESDSKSTTSTTESKPVPTSLVDPASGPSAAPAWKWYGYGTPMPGGNALAPGAASAGMSGNWHTASGTTPGAMPAGRTGGALPGLVPDPVPGPRFGPQESIFASQDGPTLPGIGSPPAAPTIDASWTPAPASLRAPSPDRIATADPTAPAATLKAPVRGDEVPVSAPTLGSPIQTPTPPPAESPDIPVEPAPGIVAPRSTGAISRRDDSLTARGRAPEPDVTAAIRRACGPNLRIKEVVPTGPRRMVVRLAGDTRGAWAARDRMARAPELAGWRIDFEREPAPR
jgi:hypothetical protein